MPALKPAPNLNLSNGGKKDKHHPCEDFPNVRSDYTCGDI